MVDVSADPGVVLQFWAHLPAARSWLILERMRTFGQVLEWADELSADEQESLVSILQSRLREQRRAQVLAAVRESRRQFRAGRCRPTSPDRIMKQIQG